MLVSSGMSAYSCALGALSVGLWDTACVGTPNYMAPEVMQQVAGLEKGKPSIA